ncbi:MULTISPECIES: hypothetical protein [unclassified Nocardia]|nr:MULTISPECIES: hypothetical protein [unclassified Nocardia]
MTRRINPNSYDTDIDLDDRIWLRQWAERRGLTGVLAPDDEPEAWAA